MKNSAMGYAQAATNESDEEFDSTSPYALETIVHTVPWSGQTQWLWPRSEKGLKVTFEESARLSRLPRYCDMGVIVQAGGACGVFPKRLSQMFETVYTFEPNPELFECLKHNAPEENIIAFNGALSDCDSKVHMFCPEQKYDINRGAWEVRPGGDIDCWMLDGFENLPKVDAIYLDVEGHEPQAIDGAMQTIEQDKPIIVVEYKPRICKRLGIEGWLEEFMDNTGYRILEENGHDKVLIHE